MICDYVAVKPYIKIKTELETKGTVFRKFKKYHYDRLKLICDISCILFIFKKDIIIHNNFLMYY